MAAVAAAEAAAALSAASEAAEQDEGRCQGEGMNNFGEDNRPCLREGASKKLERTR